MDKEKGRKKPQAAKQAEAPASVSPIPSDEQIVATMKTLKGDLTSTVLRDHFGLDKEGGRDQVRRIMKKLEADGKVEIKLKKQGKRKHYTYRLRDVK